MEYRRCRGVPRCTKTQTTVAPIQRGKGDARGRKRGKIESQLLQPALLYRSRDRLCELVNAVCGSVMQQSPEHIERCANPGQSSVPRHTILLVVQFLASSSAARGIGDKEGKSPWTR